MAVYKRGEQWWYEFYFNGKRYREPAKTSRKTIALEGERDRRLQLEKTLAGMPLEKRDHRVNSASEVVRRYLAGYELGHRKKSILFATGRLEHVVRLLGTLLLPELDQDAIRGYMNARIAEGVSGRTINMEIGELSRAVGMKWSTLWPKVRKLEERKDVGKALSSAEEQQLLAADREQTSPNRSQLIGPFIRIALLTGMRSGEIAGLTWRQIDLAARVITVGRAKSTAGTGRQIPMNLELFACLVAHAEWFTNRFGDMTPELYVFPFGKPTPSDPTRPITDITGAWKALRTRAGVSCRLHDLRHTTATKMAEAGVPESTMLALMGHMSRAMLERYSHIRMAAKREAVESLTIGEKRAVSDGVPTKIPTVGQTLTVN